MTAPRYDVRVAWSSGRPGAGKIDGRAAGRAPRSGWPFRDTDADIEATAGKPIPDIFVDDGEEAFRALERAAVAAALASFDGVLALGGGGDPGRRDPASCCAATRWSTSASGWPTR